MMVAADIPAYSRYTVKNGEFTKFGLADARGEFDKARALCALASRSGFLSPVAKRFDQRRASVTYEFLPDLTSIRAAYLTCMMSDGETADSLAQISNAGAVLATIHRGLILPETERWTPPTQFETAFRRISAESVASWMTRVPWAPAHCDYGFSNVLLGGRGARQLVVLDASANGFVTFSTALYAPIYIDIANFAACLEGLVPLKNFLRMKWRRLEKVREAFLGAYERTAGIALDRALLARVAYATAHCYFQREYGDGLVSRLAMSVLFNRLKRNNPQRNS